MNMKPAHVLGILCLISTLVVGAFFLGQKTGSLLRERKIAEGEAFSGVSMLCGRGSSGKDGEVLISLKDAAGAGQGSGTPTMHGWGVPGEDGSGQQAIDPSTVDFQRKQALPFTMPDGGTHWFEAVYVRDGLVDWIQAKALAEQAGGFLATIHSEEENRFVHELIDERKYRRLSSASGDKEVGGPFLGAFRTSCGSGEDSWRWVNGEPWTYHQWSGRDTGTNGDIEACNDVLAFDASLQRGKWSAVRHSFAGENGSVTKAAGFIIEYVDKPKGMMVASGK